MAILGRWSALLSALALVSLSGATRAAEPRLVIGGLVTATALTLVVLPAIARLMLVQGWQERRNDE